MMNFTAIDVETANPDMSSICQIGWAKFRNGEVVEEWCSYIDPQDYFDPYNIRIHGIDENAVSTAPSLLDVSNDVKNVLGSDVIVCHTHFDRLAISRAFTKHGIEPVNTTWLDSAMIARRTWPELSRSGYGLGAVCELVGYQFRHHDALEDAKAAGQILLRASVESGLDVEAWLKRVSQPTDPDSGSSGSAIRREGNPDGPLFGEVLVFTGSLSIPRREAADLAAESGCEVASGVTKKTTMLVVGDQDIRKFAGQSKSSKHRKAESLMEKGQSIRILIESDFKALTDL